MTVARASHVFHLAFQLEVVLLLFGPGGRSLSPSVDDGQAVALESCLAVATVVLKPEGVLGLAGLCRPFIGRLLAVVATLEVLGALEAERVFGPYLCPLTRDRGCALFGLLPPEILLTLFSLENPFQTWPFRAFDDFFAHHLVHHLQVSTYPLAWSWSSCCSQSASAG